MADKQSSLHGLAGSPVTRASQRPISPQSYGGRDPNRDSHMKVTPPASSAPARSRPLSPMKPRTNKVNTPGASSSFLPGVEHFPFQDVPAERLVCTSFKVNFEDVKKPHFDVRIDTASLYSSLSHIAKVLVQSSDHHERSHKQGESLSRKIVQLKEGEANLRAQIKEQEQKNDKMNELHNLVSHVPDVVKSMQNEIAQLKKMVQGGTFGYKAQQPQNDYGEEIQFLRNSVLQLQNTVAAQRLTMDTLQKRVHSADEVAKSFAEHFDSGALLKKCFTAWALPVQQRKLEVSREKQRVEEEERRQAAAERRWRELSEYAFEQQRREKIRTYNF